MKRYMDVTLSPVQRADALLEEMGIEEKMAQVVGYFPRKPGEYTELAEKYPYGAGHVSCLEMRALDTLEEAVQWQHELQKQLMALSEHHIPAIFHMEGLCGAYLQGATSFPSGIGRGASWNPEIEQQVGYIVGRQERCAGITHTFAPVLDISRDSRMGRQGETYGEDPTLAAAMGSSFVKGLQRDDGSGRKTEGVAKHFLGSHASEGGIHSTACDISPRQLREVYGKPFQAAISAGLRGIMPCYNSINGEPASASSEIMTRLLRDEMGMDGLTVSDYCAVMNIFGTQHVCESYTHAGLRAMEAGMDVELQFKKCYNEELADWFSQGKADISILDKAVRRVLEAKFRMGLFEHPFALTGTELTECFSEEKDAAVTLQSARESMVLLKNDGILPISKKTPKIAVIGCHASTARTFYGGYTHLSMAEGMKAASISMAGFSNNTTRQEVPTIPGTPIQQDGPIFEKVLKQQNPAVKSLLEQLRKCLPESDIRYAFGYPIAGDDFSAHEEALAAAKDADLAILTVGGKNGTSSIASMGEGIDATNINLPLCQERFIEKLAELGKPFVLVHFNGRPISSNAADQYAGAILEAWNPAEAGAQAITEILLGDYNPGGKLPVSVPYNSGQIPLYYNHANGSSYHQGDSVGFANYVDMPHTPRYCFGHGLSYTQFQYEKLQLNSRTVKPNESLKVTITLRNAGRMPGDEVVQLYLKDRYASLTRPVMELSGFKRIYLAPGESKQLIFTVSPSQLAFLDRDMRWKIEAGENDVFVGSSSMDIRLHDSFTITEDAYIDPKNREFYATASI